MDGKERKLEVLAFPPFFSNGKEIEKPLTGCSTVPEGILQGTFSLTSVIQSEVREFEVGGEITLAE